MGLFDFMNKKQITQPNKTETIEIDGYIIDKNSGELLEAPIEREIYNIPDEVTKISVKARNNMKKSCKKLLFSDNSVLKETSKMSYDNFLTGFDNLLEVRLPNGVEKIDHFFDHSNTKNKINFVFPSNLKEISSGQFPPHWEELILPNVININGGTIVSHNPTLKSIVIPPTIDALQQYSINQVKNLKVIKFNEGTTKMHPQAIRGCNNLTEIYIPESLKEFYLGEDDVRPVKNNFGEYLPDEEQQKQEQERILNLYKTINGNVYHFIVPRNQFSKMAIIDNKIVFNDVFSIDINSLGQEIYVDVNNKMINASKTFTNNNQENINSTSNTNNQETTNTNEIILKYNKKIQTLEQQKKAAAFNKDGVSYWELEIKIAKTELAFMMTRFKYGDDSITQTELLNKRIQIENIKMKMNEYKWNNKLISFDEYQKNGDLIEDSIYDIEKELEKYTNNKDKHV